MAMLAVIVVVVSPLLPLNRIFGDEEDHFEDHLASLNDHLEYSFESGKPAESYRPEDGSGDGTRIAQQPEQQAESGRVSRISDILSTAATPDLCSRDSGETNAASARNVTDSIQYASGEGGFEPGEATGVEVVGASEVECSQRAKQGAATD
ncbi:MAG: hypothetical protein M3122_05685 [Actinomycetota bacterium]|nr:hypothetical protein [Actinomycetota bacterium]